ncbi:MAG: alpha/beta hydrolase [Candidatus Berkelbacteria bacterium]|nr:alpha/beta hydrolase [Candidatus Berkelbacteria bacterium]
MAKTFIRNRKNQKVSVLIEEAKNQKGLAFIMHGLGGFKEALHIQAMANAFKDKNFTVIRFDTTNTFGESEGDYKQATTTNYYQDLEDVVNWAKSQNWYKEPFVLAGHSLGGICTALYAEKYPKKVLGLAPISTVVSGKLSAEIEETKKWQQTGWRISESKSKPGLIKKLPWSHMEDRLKYDLLPNVDKLTMPVLLIVGEFDDPAPPKHQKILFNKLPGKKEFHIIKGAPHTFVDKEHLLKIKKYFEDWIDSI